MIKLIRVSITENKKSEDFMLNFKNEASSFLAANPGRAVRKFANFLKRLAAIALVCVLGFTLSSSSLANAEDQQIGSRAGEQSVNPTLENTPGDGLEIGPEIIGQPVRAVKPPTVNNVSIGDKTVSGKLTIGAGQRKSRQLDVTIRVIVNRQAGGTEEKTVTIKYETRSSNWTVALDSELAEGDKVTVTQETRDGISGGVVREVKKTLADQHKDKIKMPSGEIWIEHPDANLVNDDEQAEAIEMLKNANPNIAKDFVPKKTKFSIDGTGRAYYEVTYTDGSTSGKIEATDLKIKKVEDPSAAPTIEKVQVTDGQIIVTFAKEVAAGTKFQFVKEFRDGEDRNFSQNGSCIVDKSDSKEMSQAVTVNGTTVTFPITDKVNDLKLGREFGIAVKEPHKLRSCAKSEPEITTPDKVFVRDPHKLTDADKQAIDKAIRDANTVDGVSKLPNSREGAVYPAIIEFDKDGNVRIIDPNYVEGTWDWVNYKDGKFIPAQKEDGTYKVTDEYKDKVSSILAKNLVKNLAPKSPGIAVDTNTGKVTITPPAYENPGDDTDLASYMITYKDASNADKTVTLKRTVDATGKTTWSSDGATVDANTGVVTLQIKDLAVGATITAKAKDNGGLIPKEEKPLESGPATKTLETVTVIYDRNGGTGKMDSKKLNKGSKYKLAANGFTAPENQKFKGWKIGETEYTAGAEITVKEDTSIQAIWESDTIPVVEFVLPKTGVLSLNYVAGYAALLIVALTGVGYLRQNRREKSTA